MLIYAKITTARLGYQLKGLKTDKTQPFSLKMQPSEVFFLRHVYENYLNVLIELWPNPGLVQAPSVKPGLSRYNLDLGFSMWASF